MQETNKRLLTDPYNETTLTISAADDFAFTRILSILQQDKMVVTAVTIAHTTTSAGNPVQIITGLAPLLGTDVPVTITIGEDKGISFATLESELSGVDLLQLGKTLMPFRMEKLEGCTLPSFPSLSLYAEAASGSNNEFLEITAHVATTWNPLGIDGLSLKNIYLSVIKELSPASLRHRHKAVFGASLAIREKVVPVEVTIPLGANDWRIRVPKPAVLPSLTDLISLIAGDDTVAAMPAALQALPSLQINTLDIFFEPAIARLLRLEMDVASAGSWQISPELSLESIRLQLKMVYDAGKQDFPYNTTGRITGKMRTGQLYFLASVPYPLRGTTILETGTTHALPDIGGLFTLIGLQNMAAVLPKGITDSGAMNIEQLRLELNLGEQKLERFMVEVSAADTWPLLPGKLEIKAFALRLDVIRQAASWGISGRISGTAIIYDTPVAITCGRSTPTNDWDFSLTAPLALPDITTLATITDTATTIDSLFPADSLFRQIALTVERFAIKLDKQDGHLAAFGFGLHMPSTVTIIPDILSVADIKVEIDISQPTDATNRKISGYLSGTLTFATVSAMISCKLEEGLVLSGNIPSMQLSSMVQALTGATIPPEIPDVTCTDIAFILNTATKAWTFKGKATTDWDYAGNGTPLHAAFDIEIAHSAAGAVTAAINVQVNGDVAFGADCKLHTLDLSFAIKENHEWSASGSLKALLLGAEMTMQAAYQAQTLSLSWTGSQEEGKEYVPVIQSPGTGVFGCSAISFTIGKQGTTPTRTWALEAAGVLEITNYFTLRGVIVFRRDAQQTITLGFHANTDARPVDDTADIRLDISIPQNRQAASLSGAIREIDMNKLATLFLGNAALPSELPAVRFKNLAFSLQPYAGTFSFSGEATADWQFANGTQPLHSTATLSVARNKGDDGQLRMQGALKTAFTGNLAITDHCRFQSFQLDVVVGQQQSPVIEGKVKFLLYDHVLDASAGYKDNSLQLTADLHELELLKIDGLVALQAGKLAFIYKRQQANTAASWEMDATAAITLEHVGTLAGTLQLFNTTERSGMTFTTTSAPLDVALPVPGQQLSFLFGFDHFSVFKTSTAGVSSWQMEAALNFGIKGLPEKTCRLFGEPDKINFKTTLRLQDSTFHIHLDKLIGPIAIPIPDIEKEGKPLSLGIAQLLISDLDIQIGKEMGISIVGGLRIPAELDRIFGELSHPFFNAFNPAKPDETTVKLQLGIKGSKVEVTLLTSPIAAVKMENGWVHLDLGDCGKLKFTPPVFSLNGGAFAAAINVEREGDLAIPVSLLKKLLVNKLQLDKVAALLPDKVPISNIKFFDDNRKLLAGPFITALAPTDEIKSLLETAIEAINKTVDYLPERLVNNYMQFSLPQSFHADISVTATGNVELSIGVGEKSDPIRVLYPMMAGPLPALGGMELRSLSFGSLFGGSLFSASLNATFDQFDILSLGAAAIAGWLPEASRQLLPDTRKFQQTLTIEDLYAIIVYQTVIPIPIPLFYKHIGIDHYGLEGLHIHGHISFPKPAFNLAEMFSLLKDLKQFFTDPNHELLASETAIPKDVNLVFTFENSYIMLPTYLGGTLVGKKQGELVQINAAKIIAKVLNTIKFFSLRKLIESIPVEYRIAQLKSEEHSRLLDYNFNLAYALTTPGEFNSKQEVIQTLQLTNENIDRFFTQPLPANTEGIVFLGKGHIDLWNALKMDVRLGIVAVQGRGFVTHMHFYGAISDLLEVSATGNVKVDKQDHQNPVLLDGQIQIRSSLFNGHDILKAAFEYKYIEGKNYFVFGGFLNLFPDNLPVKLESVSRINGRWSNDTFSISNAETRLTLPVLGTFTAHTTLLLSEQRQEFYTIVTLNNRQATLQISNNENEFMLKGEFDVFEIGSILRISSSDGKSEHGKYKGAEIFILTNKAEGKLKAFYLDARITFLGIYAGVKIAVMDDAWRFTLSEGFKFPGVEAKFLLDCSMAPDLGKFEGKSTFALGLQFTIPKISFWIWFFGWHEIVIFERYDWHGEFNSALSIKVYNPATYASTFDYEQALRDVSGRIETVAREMAVKKAELEAKKQGVSKKREDIKDHTRTREEVLQRVKELQPRLVDMQIIYRLFEAREKKGSDNNWVQAYDEAWNTYSSKAESYLSMLARLGFATEEQQAYYIEQVAYLDKIYEYIAAYGHRSWGYNMYTIRQVLQSREAPDYDIVLQFVLKADEIKQAHFRRYNIVYTPVQEASEIASLQQRCIDLNILDSLFDARSKQGSDPDWGNDYERARTPLLTAVNAYVALVEQKGWHSDEEHALLLSRLNFLDKIKENTAVYSSQLYGYTLEGINQVMKTTDISQYDIVYQLLYEVEQIKLAAINRNQGAKKYEYNAVLGRRVANGFGYNMEYHEQDVTYGLLNTDEGIYQYLEEEIISYQVTLRKLQEEEKAIRVKKAQVEAAKGQPLRFELQLKTDLTINGHHLYLPDISILVAPNKLEDILHNISDQVFQTIKDNLWSTIIDIFTNKKVRSNARSLRGNEEMPMQQYRYIRHSSADQQGHSRRLMAAERTVPPEGYDPAYDLTSFIE